MNDPMSIDPGAGRVLRFPGMENLTAPGVEWSGNGAFEMVWEQDPDLGGCYRLERRDPDIYPMMAGSGLTLKPNRSYIISVLLNCSYERPAEINLGLWFHGEENNTILFNLNGIPNQTEGWQRWEWEFTTDPRCDADVVGRFYFQPWDFKGGDVRIADIALIEVPEKPLRPYARGEGVTFRGGPGNLPMHIEEVLAEPGRITVRTSGTRYTFGLEDDTILAEQLLERQRPVALWRSSVSLDGLAVLSQTTTECVLANDAVTFGVQCDGLVMIAPHQEMKLTCESRIGGTWNRLIHGHLLAIDDYGGFAANLDIPLGSGRLARVDVLTDGLDFPGLADNTDFLSAASPGWQIAWTLSPGERIAISTFPPRPFDWKRSFEMNWCLTFNGLDLERYQKWQPYIDVVVLWDFCYRGYGMSWGPDYTPYNEDVYRRHIAEIKRLGMKPINYMSAYFYYSRDPEEYIAEVKRHRDDFGIQGVYSDGVPSQEWIVAYEETRMLRELFPDGTVILHTTGQTQNGGPPLALPDIFIPAVDAYTTATYRGEWVLYEGGSKWPYPRFISSQYRKANCIGFQKGDRWEGVPQPQQDLINLYYNGRACHWPGVDPPDYFVDRYYPALMELKALWEEKGSQPDFYERHYIPKVRDLIGDVGQLSPLGAQDDSSAETSKPSPPRTSDGGASKED